MPSYTPRIGGSPGVDFPLQFPRASVSSYSLATTLIEQLANDGTETLISHGTGSFWRYAGEIWLVSARHVFSGTSPFDDSPMSSNGYLPNLIRIHGCTNTSFDPERLSCTIVLKDEKGSRTWFQDPQFIELRTDIAAIPVQFRRSDIVCMNDDPEWNNTRSTDLFTHIGFQCSILGYPNPHVTGFMTPVWRSGSIASEPLLPVDNKPMFLVDAATGPGFSGGAVFRTHICAAPVHADGGSVRIEVDAVLSSQFIGVYAGRLQHRHYGGEVPFAFYGNRVPLILSSRA